MIPAFNGYAPVSTATVRAGLATLSDMEAAKIVDLFMEIRERAARADEQRAEQGKRLEQIERQLADIREDQSDTAKRNSDFGRRLEALEKRGLGGWLDSSTPKRLAVVTGLVIGLGAAIVVIARALAWLSAHVHF